jgi:hypothetical protein
MDGRHQSRHVRRRHVVSTAAERLQRHCVFVFVCLLEYVIKLAIESSARKFYLLAAISVSLAACASGSGTSLDAASVSGTISRGGTTGSGTTSGGTTSGSTSGGTTAAGGTTTGGSTSGGTTSGGTTGTGTTGGGTTSISGGSLAKAPPTIEKSIAGWVSCDGTTDDTEGVARALAAARHSAFTLLVDCPVRLHFGIDIARTIFIDSGTNVTFSGAGKFTVDNVFHPAFVMANSNDIVLTNWNLEYDASLPANWKTGGYEDAGQFVASDSNAPPAGAFNDLTLTKWLSANRGIAFDSKQGHVVSPWVGPTNTSAVFFVTGDTYNVTVTGMRLYAPPAAGADRFVPMAFSISSNFKSKQTVTAATPQTAVRVAIPHNLTFYDIDFDGIYMGWQGNAQNAVFDKVRSHRYSDLQDANGGNVGGVGKWFAPPHLFYLNYHIDGDPALFNKNLRVHDVVDAGPRIGKVRDKGGADTISGFAESIKIGGVDCSVDGYISNRPDGFMDILSSNGLTISNVIATYNSAFLNNLFSGLRFPQLPYKDVTLDNVSLTDTAPSSVRLPIQSAAGESNENIVFKNVRAVINQWSGPGLPFPVVAGTGYSISMEVSIQGTGSHIAMVGSPGLEVTLQATPAKLKVGDNTTLKWLAKGATSCSTNGAWVGTVPSGGSRVVTAGSAGSHEYVFYCQNSGSSSSAVLPVVVDD